MSKRKAMSSDKARKVRAQGHLDALEFAKLIGMENDYRNNSKAKKDVVDPIGDTHSVKSGTKRWQIFLYGKNRFESDDAFQSMNGIGQLLIKCIDVFPDSFDEYKKDKQFYKDKLRIPMRELQEKLSLKRRLRTFLNKSIFNGGEVDYLTVKHNDLFHVFFNVDVINAFSNNLEVVNSQARRENETPELKVLFKFSDHNLGELEIRNSGANHYKEVLFVMNKLKVIELLFKKIPFTGKYNEKVYLYGQSKNKFGKWNK